MKIVCFCLAKAHLHSQHLRTRLFGLSHAGTGPFGSPLGSNLKTEWPLWNYSKDQSFIILGILRSFFEDRTSSDLQDLFSFFSPKAMGDRSQGQRAEMLQALSGFRCASKAEQEELLMAKVRTEKVLCMVHKDAKMGSIIQEDWHISS